MMHREDDWGSHGRARTITHILLLASLGAITIVSQRLFKRRCRQRSVHSDKHLSMTNLTIVPLLGRTESGRVGNLERFPHYAARQIGFADPSNCPQLCKLIGAYLKKSKGYEEDMYEYFGNEPEGENLYVKLVEELERCILSYFAFHWPQASQMVTQVLSDEPDHKVPKLKDFVMAATRKQRFEKVTKDLKVTRVFSTLVEEMKAIREASCTDVMVPVAHSHRSPVLLLMGGGMGAGKSTVLKDILKEPFWSGAAANAVVVEADAFKETDVIYKALSSRGHHNDMLQTAELVHQNSTDAASSLLVTALNEGRDVIMDGTLSWEPFVAQTIEMARNVHKCRYRMGAGYKVAKDGTVTEKYWEQVKTGGHEQSPDRKPYRVELVGVVCDAYLAVVRGIRRSILVRRAVRVNSQLKSHKRFANAFPRYCDLVDNARLYSTNEAGQPPRLIAWKDGDNKLLVEPEDIKCLSAVSEINPNAESIYELYPDSNHLHKSGSVWNEVVQTPSRTVIQKELRLAIQRIEEALPGEAGFVGKT